MFNVIGSPPMLRTKKPSCKANEEQVAFKFTDFACKVTLLTNTTRRRRKGIKKIENPINLTRFQIGWTCLVLHTVSELRKKKSGNPKSFKRVGISKFEK